MQPVETSDPEGVDYGWVMQTTFVVTIVVGAPIVALLSLPATLPTWAARVEFAIRVGAVVWFLVAVAVFAYAKRVDAGDGGRDPDEIPSEEGPDADAIPSEEGPDAAEIPDERSEEPTTRTDNVE